MGLFHTIFNRKRFDKNLTGSWNSDVSDQATRESLGEVTMTFTGDGKLIYTILEKDSIQKINMIYWTEDDILYTDQPSHPRQEKTTYKIEDQKVLILEFGGEITRFNKG